MNNSKDHKAAAEPLLDCRVGRWPSGFYPGTWTSTSPEKVRLGRKVYSLSVVSGKVVIDQLTAKEAAVDEIRAQPFFAPNAKGKPTAANEPNEG